LDTHKLSRVTSYHVAPLLVMRHRGLGTLAGSSASRRAIVAALIRASAPLIIRRIRARGPTVRRLPGARRACKPAQRPAQATGAVAI